MNETAGPGPHGRPTIRNKVLMIIVDGYGFDPEKEEAILASVEQKLPQPIVQFLGEQFDALGADRQDQPQLVRRILTPTPVTRPGSTSWDPSTGDEAARTAEAIREKLAGCAMGDRSAAEVIASLIREESRSRNYAIWAAKSPYVFSLRRDWPTVVTKPSGLDVGYEDLEPEVQGNSETGHQQLGNLTVAVQPPLAISLAIDNGEFLQNEVLREAVAKVCNTEANMNVCFLLSGEHGDDGRVHSCWNHLEAFLRLCFEEFAMEPSRLRIQAILDGRDSPPRSSVEAEGEKYNFLGKLVELLRKYDAEEALAWVIGRSIGMDRDYDEVKTKTDYELMTQGKGETVPSAEAAIAKVVEQHREGCTDAYVDPIAVCDKDGQVRCIAGGDVFVDLNFRADRQRAKVGALLGAKAFLQREAGLKGATWELDWLDDNLHLDVSGLTEYHPDLAAQYGAKVAFPTLPNAHNFLALTAKASKDLGFPFRYLLLAESTKALHVGYFIRGRREKPEVPGCEERIIVPSFGHEAGVETDDDYYKTPQMKAFEIAGALAGAIYREVHDLIIVNFSNPDMIGHLICEHFDETVQAVEVIDSILQVVIPFAESKGFHVVLTADHGNSDDFSPAHGSHDVLTTFLSPRRDLALRGDLDGKAKLFDLPWCILDILGVREAVAGLMADVPEVLKQQGLVGKSLVAFRE